MFNLAVVLEHTSRRCPDTTAFIFQDTRLSFAELNTAANKLANGLKSLGIGRGDKVALSCPNLPYFPICYYGILKVGATVVPLNILLKGREVAYHLENSDAMAYLCYEGSDVLPTGKDGHSGFSQVQSCRQFVMIMADPSAPSPIDGTATLAEITQDQSAEFDTVQTTTEDTAVILYTSGTTGQAKGAELTHFNMFYNAVNAAELFDMREGDVGLIALPLFHVFGQTVQMNAGVFKGITGVMLPQFNPDDAYKLMESEAVTTFAGVPTMYWALLNHAGADHYDLRKISSNLRVCCSGGASLPLELMKNFEAKFKVTILEGYGLSETSPVATFNRCATERKPGSIGKPIWGVEVKVVDANDNELPPGEPGEIVIRGPNIMKGYYKRPEANAEALRGDWFHTGDVATMDEDGFFFVVDRVKDMIIRGGYNVYPREIEEVLMTHPAVSLVAVIGVPHPSHGEEVKAFIVCKDGAAVTEEAIIAWSRDNMAGYKYPRLVEFKDTLPMNATGKILKRELRV